MAAVILLLLFLVQRLGTAAVGRAFGPVMLLWFVFIAILGAIGIGKAPHVIAAVDPLYAARVSDPQRLRKPRHPRRGVSLRDRRRSHVRRHGPSRPRADPHRLERDRLAGVAAQLCRPDRGCACDGGGDANPFFALVPGWALYPAVVLATLATVIASQAIITGVVLADPASDAARLAAGNAYQSDVIGSVWPDLRAVRELADDAGDTGADGDIRAIGSARRRLWRGGVHHHADDHGDPLSHHAGIVAVAGLGRDRGVRAFHHRRCRFLRRQSPEDRPGRLDTAVGRRT